ncbi:hypothetical protein BKA62DRAFT_789834 [Auriculariales sp. MPI-PUGE-AT-0066]|nr:hypothetical protein BKA62DRAFT_789834 [Auriculariales sp. MPI-PUGE-AT-0066]
MPAQSAQGILQHLEHGPETCKIVLPAPRAGSTPFEAKLRALTKWSSVSKALRDELAPLLFGSLDVSTQQTSRLGLFGQLPERYRILVHTIRVVRCSATDVEDHFIVEMERLINATCLPELRNFAAPFEVLLRLSESCVSRLRVFVPHAVHADQLAPSFRLVKQQHPPIYITHLFIHADARIVEFLSSVDSSVFPTVTHLCLAYEPAASTREEHEDFAGLVEKIVDNANGLPALTRLLVYLLYRRCRWDERTIELRNSANDKIQKRRAADARIITRQMCWDDEESKRANLEVDSGWREDSTSFDALWNTFA